MLLVLVFALAACGAPARSVPSPATVWGTPVAPLVLGIDAGRGVATAFLHNRGSSSQRVIASGVRLTLERPGWRGEVFDHGGAHHLDRDETFVVIAPGGQHAISIDLGARSIEPGTYTMTASYNSMTALAGDWWYGVLEAGPITVDVE